jgi:flagellar operon protein
VANNTILYPNVSRLPGSGGVGDAGASRPASEGPAIQKGEFDQAMNQALSKDAGLSKAPATGMINPNLGGTGTGLKFSAHATQRLRERQIQFDPQTMARMNDAISKADAKGLTDTLLLTDQAALIVNVPNRTVVTAMDREKLIGNVFTNIDGAVII